MKILHLVSLIMLFLNLNDVLRAEISDVPITVRPHLEAIDRAVERARNKASADELALIEADLAFALDSRNRSVGEAFADRMLPQGKLIGGGQPVRIGPGQVRDVFADNKATWWWGPEEAISDGQLGVTWGIACIAVLPGEGQPDSIYRTRYVTVWRKDERGEWKIWLDMGNPGPGLEPIPKP